VFFFPKFLLCLAAGKEKKTKGKGKGKGKGNRRNSCVSLYSNGLFGYMFSCPFEHQLLLGKEKKKNLQVFAFIIFLFLLKLILRLNFLGNQTWDLGYYVYLDDYYSG